MKRSGFKRKTPERYQPDPDRVRVTPSVRPEFRMPESVAAPAAPVEKFRYLRSDALMRAYRLIPCQHCGRQDGTVCGAHSNWPEHGKGRSIKASDEFCASLCFACHGALDQGVQMTAEQRKAMWTAAWRKTRAALLNSGLWPSTLPEWAKESEK